MEFLKLRQSNTALIDAIRHSAPYVNLHSGRTFVILIGGDTLKDSHISSVISDIAILQSLGIKLVLVFGAKPQIDQALEEANISSKFHRHLRISDDQTFKIIKRICGEIQLDLTAKFSMGISNTPMQGANIGVVSGNFVTAKPIGVVDGVDFCHSGSVRRINKRAIKDELDRGNIVLISPIGVSEAEDYLHKLGDDDFSNTARYLRAAVASCKAGVPRSHLVSHIEDGALIQELFTRDGIGTQIVQESAEQCLQATVNDIPSLMELIRPFEESGALIHRAREQLELEIDHYIIIKRDGMVIGSAALYCYDNKMAELACLVIHPEYRNSNRADILIEKITHEALNRGIEKLFVLTTKTAHFFQERGFEEGAVSDLPFEKASHYNYNRNSKIFIKNIVSKE